MNGDFQQKDSDYFAYGSTCLRPANVRGIFTHHTCEEKMMEKGDKMMEKVMEKVTKLMGKVTKVMEKQ